MSRGSAYDPERALLRYEHGDHRGNGGRDRRYQLTRTRSDEVTGGPMRKRAKHSRHDREPERKVPRPRYLSETSHVPRRYRLGSGEERSPTYPGPPPLGTSARFRRNETEKTPPEHRQTAICRPRKDFSSVGSLTMTPTGVGGNPDKPSSPIRPRSRSYRSSHPSQTTRASSPTALPSPQRQQNQQSHLPSPKKLRPPTTTTGPRYENDTYRSALAENFIRSVSGTYKTMNRAEERKRILSNQLPSCIKSKSIANSFMFCTPADGDHLEAEIATTRRYQKRIVDFGRLDAVIQNVSCRVRRRPMSATLTPRQAELIRAVRVISVAFNRITFVARIKHYCDRETRLANYLRDELTKRCSEGSRLNSGIRQFIGLVDLERHRDLCLVFVGMLSQTPHMWARSIRLLSRLKIFYQNTLVKLFADDKIDLKDVFDMPYHSMAQKILGQVKQYTTSAFTLNEVMGGVVDAMRQRQSIAPPLVFSSVPTPPPTSSSSAAAAAMAMATTVYEDRYNEFAPSGSPRSMKSDEQHKEYTFYPNTGRKSNNHFSSDENDCEDDEAGRESLYNGRETDTDSPNTRRSPIDRKHSAHELYDSLENDILRYDDPFSSSSSPSLPIEILQPLSPIPCDPAIFPVSGKGRTENDDYSPKTDTRSGDVSSSSSSPSSYSSSSSSSSSSGTGSSHSSASEEPMTVSPYRTRGGTVTTDTSAIELKFPTDTITTADFAFSSPMQYLDRDSEVPQNFISVHVGRSSPPTTRTQRECINIMLDSR